MYDRFRSFLSNPDISVLDGNVLDKHHNSDFYRFVRVPLSDGEHSVEALFGQMCSNYPTSMSKNHFSEQHNLEFMAYVVDHEKTYAESYEFLRLFDVTSAYTGPHSAMGEMTKTLWNYLEQKTILDPDYEVKEFLAENCADYSKYWSDIPMKTVSRVESGRKVLWKNPYFEGDGK